MIGLIFSVLICYTHCPKTNLNLSIKTEPVTGVQIQQNMSGFLARYTLYAKKPDICIPLSPAPAMVFHQHLQYAKFSHLNSLDSVCYYFLYTNHAIKLFHHVIMYCTVCEL